MEVRFRGSGGAAGWPEPGCRCASCLRAAAAGAGRGRTSLLVDGVLAIDPGAAPGGAAGYQVAPVPGGWDITGPDGARLLVAAGPGAIPEPPAGTAPFDVAVLDLLDSAAPLGGLRARGLIRPDTPVALLCADHRISSEPELARRCRLWGVLVTKKNSVLTSAAGAPRGAPAPRRALVLGGARSGKSAEAELRVAAEPQVTYLAAGPAAGADAEWAARVAAHQARRPPWWRTVETTDLAGALAELRGAVLIDGIGTWLAAVMDEAGAWEPEPGDAAGRVAARLDELIAAWRQVSAVVVAVSDEVGSGVVPPTPAGRRFRDELGALNQRLAAESEETVLVIAGRVLDLAT